MAHQIDFAWPDQGEFSFGVRREFHDIDAG